MISVTNRAGDPIQKLRVTSQSHSGLAGYVETDAQGMAAPRPGENEIVALCFNDQRVRLRPPGWRTDFFLPICDSGIVFDVSRDGAGGR